MRKTKKVLSILLVFILIISNFSFSTKSNAIEELPKLEGMQGENTIDEKNTIGKSSLDHSIEETTKVEEKESIGVDQNKSEIGEIESRQEENKLEKSIEIQSEDKKIEESLELNGQENLYEESTFPKERGIQEESDSPDEKYGDFSNETVTFDQLKYALDEEAVEAELRFIPSSTVELVIPDTIFINEKEYKVTSIKLIRSVPHSLSKVKFSKYLKVIKYFSFSETQLTEVEFPESLEVIGDWAFYRSKISGDLKIGGSIRSIGDNAFVWNNIRSLTIGDSVKKVGITSFLGNPIEKMELGNNIERIGMAAFSNTNLVHIKLPNSIKELDMRVFEENKNLESIFIGDSIETIGYGQFFGCSNLKYIYTSMGNVDHLRELLLKGGMQCDPELDNVILTSGEAFQYSDETQKFYEVSKGENISFSVKDAEKQYRHIGNIAEDNTTSSDWVEVRPSYQWQKDDLSLEGEIGQTLLLKDIQGGDTGSYHVVVNGNVLEDIQVAMKPVPTLDMESNKSSEYLGKQIDYTITVGNQERTENWKDVIVKSMISSEGEYVSGSLQLDGKFISDDSWNKDGLFLPLGDLEGGETHKITYAIKIKSMPEEAVLENNTFVESSNLEEQRKSLKVEVLENKKPQEKDPIPMLPLEKNNPDSGDSSRRLVVNKNIYKGERKNIKYIPKTGDDNRVALYIGILLISVFCLYIFKKKRDL